MKKIFKITCSSLMAFTLLATAACNRDQGEQIDQDKTTIFVGNIDGGVGEEWIKAIKTRFEEQYKDYKLGDKTGVQVLITTTGNVAGNQIGTALKTLPYDVYFTEMVYYNQLVSNGDLLDLTDTINSPLSAFGETKSIGDKIYDDYKNYLTVNNKIYAVPHYDSSYGLYYDVDMFDNFGFYFAGDSTEQRYAKKSQGEFVFTDLSGKLSSGPNGVVGDYDDGLPATYEQFYALCEKMKESNVTPFTYTGTYSFYCTRFLSTMASAAMGDDANLFFNFNGETDKYVTGFDGDGNPILGHETITTETGYKAFQLEGKYQALKFIETLIRNSYINNKSFSTYSHLDAQQDFIKGSYRSTFSKSNITNYGILCEGSWWSNESKTFYDDMANGDYGNGALEANRKIAVMPLPHVNDSEIGQKTALLSDANLSLAFISNSVDSAKAALCKEFLQYCYTDKSLSEFSSITNMLKGVKYDISAEDEAKMSYYGKSLLTYRDDCKVVYPFSSNPIYRNYSSSFILDSIWNSIIENNKYSNPAATLKNNTKLTAEDYFLGLANNYSASYWSTAYKIN